MALPVLIQHSNFNTGTSAGGTITLTPAWGVATTAGSLLLGIIAVRSAGPTPVAIPVPSAGWTLAKSQSVDLGNGGGRGFVGVYYKENASSESGTVTWTSSGGYMSSAAACMTLMEYSGPDTSSSLDKTAGAASATDGTGSIPYTAATSVSTGTTATTAQANELLIAALYTQQTPGSPSNGFSTQDTASRSGIILTMADKIVSATGAYETSQTYTPAASNAGVIVTFKYTAAAANVTRSVGGGAAYGTLSY